MRQSYHTPIHEDAVVLWDKLCAEQTTLADQLFLIEQLCWLGDDAIVPIVRRSIEQQGHQMHPLVRFALIHMLKKFGQTGTCSWSGGTVVIETVPCDVQPFVDTVYVIAQTVREQWMQQDPLVETFVWPTWFDYVRRTYGTPSYEQIAHADAQGRLSWMMALHAYVGSLLYGEMSIESIVPLYTHDPGGLLPSQYRMQAQACLDQMCAWMNH